jgi:transposase InsO family protein
MVLNLKVCLKEMYNNLGIKCSPTTSYNPQGNSIIERIHRSMGYMLRAFELEERELDPYDPWNYSLQVCAFESSVHFIQLYKLAQVN